MHHANHFYGHAHVLARYCGLDAAHPPRMQGYLQHGWNIGDGLARGVPYVERSPIFVWSDRTRRRAWSLGRRNVVVTGAPFLYLLAIEAQASPASPVAAASFAPVASCLPAAPAVSVAEASPCATGGPEPLPPREGTIWYPFHGWEGQELSGDHRRLIDTIWSVEPGPVTVCLYWNEYHNRRIRRVYERAGFRVICHGYRGHWWERTDTGFLHKQLAELRAHRRVASNRLSSAVLYGTLVGCEPAVYGDPMVLRDEDPTHGGFNRIVRQWPQIHGEQVDPVVCAEVAAAELGADCRASPAELREILGWPEPGGEV